MDALSTGMKAKVKVYILGERWDPEREMSEIRC